MKKKKVRNNKFNYIDNIWNIVNMNYEKENNFVVNKNFENNLYDELSDSFFEKNNLEVSYIIEK